MPHLNNQRVNSNLWLLLVWVLLLAGLALQPVYVFSQTTLSTATDSGATEGLDSRIVSRNDAQTTLLINTPQAIQKSNGRIVFSRPVSGPDPEIFSMNADGTGLLQLTNTANQNRDPAWSPDGSKIVFTSSRDGNDEIYVMNADGSNQRRITFNSGIEENPAWSPDGTKIAFVSDRSGGYHIYVTDLDGSIQTRLTTNIGGNDVHPQWSPDGAKIVYSRLAAGGSNYQIYVMNADGSNALNLSGSSATQDYTPFWSPDGTRIVFSSSRGGHQNIYVMNADGSGQIKISNLDGDLSPAWAPDGTQIIFSSLVSGNAGLYTVNADGTGLAKLPNSSNDSTPSWQPLKKNGKIAYYASGDNSEIYSIYPDGNNQVRLTFNPAIDVEPKWSPDGTRILFVSARDGNAELYLMNADGSNQTRLTNYPLSDISPNWSPDGTKIAFSRVISDHYQIYVMNADGTNAVRISNNTVDDDSPSWSPDGTRIVFRRRADSSNIYVMNADGSNQVNIIHGVQPAWSPDGTKILFVSDIDNLAGEIYVMNSKGSQVVRLTTNSGLDEGAQWSPDGKQIVFSSDRSSGNQLYVMNADGSSVKPLTNSNRLNGTPTWGPLVDTLLPLLQFSASQYNAAEGSGSALITVIRKGDTAGTSTVDYATSNGTAVERTDYTTARGTLNFAPGEASKTFSVLITDNAFMDKVRTVNLTLSNPTGSMPGTPDTATLNILDNDNVPPTSNPIDDAQFFVREQYADFLNRVPDEGGLGYWSNEITRCGSDAQCIHDRRVGVADAFFFEREFQQTGAYVYRIYKAAIGLKPTYEQFISDRSRVVAGAEMDRSKSDYALYFVRGSSFQLEYATATTADQFVDRMLTVVRNYSGTDLSSQRSALLALYDGTDTGKAAILRQVAESQAFIDAEYNNSFVLMEYFGYLRRDPEPGGFDFWLSQVNKFPLRDISIQHAMACSFITSEEYQTRFSSVVTHTNRECPQ